MSEFDYKWRIDTNLDQSALRDILNMYRPYRHEVSFSNGFSTAEFGDVVKFQNPTPLANLYYFERHIECHPSTRILDIGCNLGYYGHYFVGRGVRSVTGVEYYEHHVATATLLRKIAGINEQRLEFIHGDFGDRLTQELVIRRGPYNVIIFLNSLNEIHSFTAALMTLPGLLSDGGIIIIEYTAINTGDAICQFDERSYREHGDTWVFSETLIDQIFSQIGLTKIARPLEWENPEILGNKTKVMGVYQRSESLSSAIRA